MSGRRDSLSPPEKDNTKDPGAHELGWSDFENPPPLPLGSPSGLL